MIASMWLGNLFLVVLNLPLIGLWVRLITVPYHLLYPSILVFCAIGVFSLNNNEFDVALMALFGVLGHVLARLGMRAGADAACLHPGALDGGVPPAGDAALAGEPLGLRPAADQRDLARPRGARVVRRAAPGVRSDAEGSVLAGARPAAARR
jgi:hypothetical protein